MEFERKVAGEIAAITLVLRQLLARLPQDEVDEIWRFVTGRFDGSNSHSEEWNDVMTAANGALKNIFTAATHK